MIGKYLFFTSIVLVVLSVVAWTYKKRTDRDTMLVGSRNVPWLVAAFSVAASWTWAPALLVTSQKSYELGLAGFLWFAVPNIIAIGFFYFLISRMRGISQKIYTLPEFIESKFGSFGQRIYIVTIFLVQLYAVVVNLLGSTLLLSHVTDLPKTVLIPAVMAAALIIAAYKGVHSAIRLDVIKGALIISLSVVFVSLLADFNSPEVITQALLGKAGTGMNFADAATIFSFGIPTAISLIAGVIIDQQQWQRGLAIDSDSSLKKTYITSTLLFTLFLLMMGIPGFLGSSTVTSIDNTQMISFNVVSAQFPSVIALGLFTVILISLIAVLSAALCAAASIFYVDLCKNTSGISESVSSFRWFMVGCLVLAGTIVFIPKVQIIWIQMFVGSFRAALIVPTLMALFMANITPRTSKVMLISIVIAMLTGPAIYGIGLAVKDSSLYTVGSLVPIAITFVGLIVAKAVDRCKGRCTAM